MNQHDSVISVCNISIPNRYFYHDQVLITESDVADLAFIDVSGKIYTAIKRLLDIVIAIIGLSVCFIPMIMIALAVYIDDPGKVIFTQYRVGKNKKQFRLYKFRTMKLNTPQYVATRNLSFPHRYITRVGRFLRKTSLDEIPQLYNVLIGDMSLIGPRPLIAAEEDIHKMRSRFGVYRIRPGMTGLAQINGRDTVTPNQKVHYDMKYLENFGFLQDIQILLKTVPDLISGDGITEGCISIESEEWPK